MMLEQMIMLVQEGNFESSDLAEIFSIGTGLFAIILLAISLMTYRKVRLARFLLVSAAFALFAVKSLVEHIDLLLPNVDISSTVSTLLVFLDFSVLLLIFLALVKK